MLCRYLRSEYQTLLFIEHTSYNDVSIPIRDTMNKGINILVTLSLLFMSNLSAMAIDCASLVAHKDCCCSNPAPPVVEVIDSCCAEDAPAVPLQNSCDCSFEVADASPMAKDWQVVPNFTVAHTLLMIHPSEVLLVLPETANLSDTHFTSPPDHGWLVPTYRACSRIRC